MCGSQLKGRLGLDCIGKSTNEKGRGQPRPSQSGSKDGSALSVLAFVFLLLADDFLAGRLIDNLHGQANLAALIKAHQLNEHLIAFLDDIGGLLNALLSKLRDVNEAVARTEEVHECTEVSGLDDRAFVDLANFRLGYDRVDPLLGRLDLLAAGRGDLDGAIVFDVDLGASLLDDLADDLAARTDNVADLVGRDLHHFDARRKLAEL